MGNEQLTARQEIFARHYALTGRASRSAIAAGVNTASARTRAYIWLKRAEIQERIREIQAAEFRGLKRQVELEALGMTWDALHGGGYRKGLRAIRMLERLGVLGPVDSRGKQGV